MNDGSRIQLVNTVICPYCWDEFPPEDVNWISEHRELAGDSRVRGDMHRFLPSRFNLDGNAYDEKGNVCYKIACPGCHGQLARGLLEMRPHVLSVLGAPRSGKSFYLGAMLKRLDDVLGIRFGLRFESALSDQNHKIISYKETLFSYDDPSSVKWIDKTQLVGVEGLYRNILHNGEDKMHSIPCMFAVQPQKNHPAYAQYEAVSRMLCLYDCAGEHFMPGHAEAELRVIDHLAKSNALLFVFDPFQETRFRTACSRQTDDPQVTNDRFRVTCDQSQVLHRAAERIRERNNKSSRWKYDRPLIVLVNKVDGWRYMLGDLNDELDQIVKPANNGTHALDLRILYDVSAAVERLLDEYAPSIVNVANSFADEILYVPVSATGGPPTVFTKGSDEDDLGFRAEQIHPLWAEVPVLYSLSRSARDQSERSLIQVGKSPAGSRPRTQETVIPLRQRKSSR